MAKDVTNSLSSALDAIRREEELLKSVRSGLEPSSFAIKALQVDPGVERLLEGFRQQGEAMRVSFGPSKTCAVAVYSTN
jgi:hypothetical protein